MLDRFPGDVIGEKPAFVIILGGANDIGWGLDPSTIACNLTSMYDAARKEGIGPVACSVPSILGCDELIPPRLSLNQMIDVEAKKRKIPFLDLFRATADQTNNRLLEIYCADGLHLNPQGYKQIAKHIFDNWLKFVLGPHTPDTIPANRGSDAEIIGTTPRGNREKNSYSHGT